LGPPDRHQLVDAGGDARELLTGRVVALCLPGRRERAEVSETDARICSAHGRIVTEEVPARAVFRRVRLC
jgi:hypothetical protein